MTKNEQNRVLAWRLKLILEATSARWRTARGRSALKTIYEKDPEVC
jgi:hypothetical protein